MVIVNSYMVIHGHVLLRSSVVEQRSVKPLVVSSNLTGAATRKAILVFRSFPIKSLMYINNNWESLPVIY